MASRKPAFAHARPSFSHVSLGASSDSISGSGKERHLLHRDLGGSTCSLGRRSRYYAGCPRQRLEFEQDLPLSGWRRPLGDVVYGPRSGARVNQQLTRPGPTSSPFIYNITSSRFRHTTLARASQQHTPSLALTASDYAIISDNHHSLCIDHRRCHLRSHKRAFHNDARAVGARQWTPRYEPPPPLLASHETLRSNTTPTSAILTPWCARCSRCASASPRPPPRLINRSPCHGHWQRSAPARPDGTRPATTRAQEYVC
jgi:hypothetical protein